MDVRQVMGAILTFSMFMMLANMIKRDHFDGDVLLEVPVTSNVEEEDSLKVMKHRLIQVPGEVSKDHAHQLKLCWNNSFLPKGREESKGYVTFSLTNGPEYHIPQVANAVLVAKHLGATLVLPEIIGSKGEKRAFEDIYDADKFITTMSGVIRVERRKRPQASTQKLVSVQVPYNANRNYISTNIEPLFKTTQNLRVKTYFASPATRQGKVESDMTPYSCLATFEALHLKPELQDSIDAIVKEIKSRDSKGEFIAIDYKGEMPGTSATEIARFLQRTGYTKDTTIYVTKTRPDRSLNMLKDFYPKTFTKGDVMQEAMKKKFLDIGSSELEQDIIDFHLCSRSDVFVPTIPDLFFINVVGNRIAASKTEILVPDHLSPYISKGTHPAYACFCH